MLMLQATEAACKPAGSRADPSLSRQEHAHVTQHPQVSS